MDCTLIDLPKIAEPRGNLTFAESHRHVPFAIERAYWLYDVPGGAERGGHAHRTLHQFLVALSGSFDVVVDDGLGERRTIQLNRPFRGLHLKPMHWRTLENFSSGAVCLVLASAHFSEADYLRDHAAFVAEKKSAR